MLEPAGDEAELCVLGHTWDVCPCGDLCDAAASSTAVLMVPELPFFYSGFCDCDRWAQVPADLGVLEAM